MALVIFKNKGTIDPRAIKTFGMSAKVNDNPIGFFGTGLKYSISIFVRNDVDIKMITGGERYSFEKKKIEMRGKGFEVITMNGEELPFATNLGINWELWQAFRELYCNALDEGGDVEIVHLADDEHYLFENDHTYFVLDDDRAVELFMNRNSIVLQKKGKPVILSCDNLQIFNIPSKFAYYRGVRVMELPGGPSPFTYNVIENTELTEDRTVKNPSLFMNRIALETSRLDDEWAIKKILVPNPDTAECAFSFGLIPYYDYNMSDKFFEILQAQYEANNDMLNMSARDVYQKLSNKRSPKNYVKFEMDEIQQKQLDKALRILNLVYPQSKKFKTMVVQDLGQKTMAVADASTETMVISSRCFTEGTKYLLSTLIEEFFHLETGYTDQSLALQTYLFDQLTTIIERHVVREPI